ncbi:hypothetical protein B4145_3880 [Bacillus subtilis]|uniref:Uncharacterized protein n=1 Tax=Bacillus subtilis subsp. subtilis TaxID=135461 RepID=A0ABD3ZXH9_BACIU|nr:hypothetical protein B4067_3984 [Bacillus subtilis subsp. subtilis]KIN57684.1 hypothetical protein B4145_3880 [Bacillus subtilis]
MHFGAGQNLFHGAAVLISGTFFITLSSPPADSENKRK